MAKISARGATEIVRVRGQLPDTDQQCEFLLRSDGHILRKYLGIRDGWHDTGTKLVKPDQDSRIKLERAVVLYGYEVVTD